MNWKQIILLVVVVTASFLELAEYDTMYTFTISCIGLVIHLVTMK